MIVFDTEDHPASDRADAVQDAFSNVCLPLDVTLRNDRGGPRCRLDVWQCANANVFSGEVTGLSMRRMPAHLNREGDDLISLTVQWRSDMRYEKDGERYVVRPGELALNDCVTAYSVAWDGTGAARAIRTTHSVLGIPADVIAAATPNLSRSPMYELVQHQMAFLGRHSAALEGTAAGEHVAESTLGMVRALILSAAGADTAPAQTTGIELVEAIEAYIRANIGNPGMTPAAIATAHCISLRVLYKLFHREMRSVEQTIIVERLRAARRLLRDAPEASVTTIAYRVGFQDPSHFARRFRSEFGVSPSEWRAARARNG